jgi:DDE_Tnp_1-associated/Transposase DDE domain
MVKAMPSMLPAPRGSLAEALAAVPDPRRPYGWRPEYPPIPLVALLQVTVAAMLCGSVGQTAIAQWVRERAEDDSDLLVALGLPAGRTPCVATFHRVFKALDVVAFEQALGTWLEQTGVPAGDALAVDGKAVRGVERDGVPGVYLVSVYAHAAETVIAQLRTAGKGHELAAARTLLGQTAVAGRVVTGDALLTDRALCAQVVAAGGDYLVPVDENQPSLRADLAAAFSPLAVDGPGRLGGTNGASVADG